MAIKPQRQQQRKKNGNKNLPTRKQRTRTIGSKSASVAAAYSTAAMGKAPIVRATRDNCVIQHRELIDSISGTSAFDVTSYSVNPGIPETFPWLSVIAQAWEKYRFRYLRFVFLTRTGSTTVGQVLMAPDFDSADDPPSSELVMATYEDAISDAPWKNICCNLKASSMNNSLGKFHFTRFGPLAANLDIKTYDCANFLLSTTDGVDGTSWGKLWVEYEVEFSTPQLPPSGLQVDGGMVVGNGAFANDTPLGDNPIVDPQSRGLLMTSENELTILHPGTYTCDLAIEGTGVTSALNITLSGSAVLVNTSIITNATSTEGVRSLVFTCGANGFLAFSAVCTTITACVFRIGQCPAGSQTL